MDPQEPLRHPDRTLNPRHWADDILIELTKDWEHPVTKDTPYDTKAALRNAAWSDWIRYRKALAKAAADQHRRRVRDSYEGGTPIPIILKHANITEATLTKWITKEGWERQPEPEVKKDIEEEAVELKQSSRSIAIVTPEEEEDLPPEIREMKEQYKLLDMTPGAAEQVPVAKWGKAMKLKVGRIAFSMLQELDGLDGKALLDPETVRTVKSLSSIAETFQDAIASGPKPKDEKQTGSALNMFIMSGAPVPKKVKAREIEA